MDFSFLMVYSHRLDMWIFEHNVFREQEKIFLTKLSIKFIKRMCAESSFDVPYSVELERFIISGHIVNAPVTKSETKRTRTLGAPKPKAVLRYGV